MKELPQFADALACIREAACRKIADEHLMDSCERFSDLWREAERLYKHREPGHAKCAAATLGERERLLQEIIKTPAISQLGCDRKWLAADCIIPESGDLGKLMRSLIWDYQQLVLKLALAVPKDKSADRF